ncbi:hypothetical protein GCM10028791_41270 [Echinicola sediminis]
MIVKRLFISFIFILFSVDNSFAQTNKASVQEGIIDFITWLTDLEDHVNDIYTEQKKNKLIRQLGYIGSDLDYLALEKSRLAEKVIEHYKNDKSQLSIEILEDYKNSIDNLSENISELLLAINEQYRDKGHDALDKIRQDLYNRKETELSRIIRLVGGDEDFNEEKIRESAKNAELYARSARNKVLDLRKQLLNE